MTERQSANTLLDDLLASNDAGTHTAADRPSLSQPNNIASPLLTERQEMQLLREAYTIGTPTLAPDGRTSADFEAHPAASAAASFSGEFKDLVQRYPVQSVLAAAGLAYILTRQRR